MNEHRANIRRLTTAAINIDGAYDAPCKAIGIKPNLLWLLYALDDEQPHTQKQICQDWGFPKTTINTLIKECQAEGYITLESIPGRRRELRICLTEQGTAYARKALRGIYAAEEAAMRDTVAACSPAFIDALELFAANLRRAFAAQRSEGSAEES